MHIRTISNGCGELAILVIDWPCKIARGLLKPDVLGLGWAGPACSYRGAERGVDLPGVVETRYLARTKPGERSLLLGLLSVAQEPWACGIDDDVWRSHCDKRKEIGYNDFLKVLIVSSNSQAHNDDYGPTLETAVIISKWESMGHQQNLGGNSEWAESSHRTFGLSR